MREIKFRAWDGEQMVSPDYIDRDGIAWWKANSIPTMSKILMQFTGLKDRNGREIWEGDIVSEFRRSRRFPDGRVANKVISWSEDMVLDDSFGETAIGFNVFAGELEVIGNIHENPELLK